MLYSASSGQINKNNNDRTQRSIVYKNILLDQLCAVLSMKFGVEFIINIKEKIIIREIIVNEAPLEDIIISLCKKYDLKYEKIDNKILITRNHDYYWTSYITKVSNKENLGSFWQEVENVVRFMTEGMYSLDKYNGIINVYGSKSVHEKIKSYLSSLDQILKNKDEDYFWATYPMKFFFEDELSGLSSFFDEIKVSASKSAFWEEIEKTIKTMTDNKYSIDKYNGIINIFGNKETHQKTKDYLDNVRKNLYKQIAVECNVLEVVSNASENINLQPVLDKIKFDDLRSTVQDCILSFVKVCQNLYSNLNFKTSTNINMLLMSQNTGRVISSKVTHYLESQFDKDSKRNFVNNTYKSKEHGFSISLSSTILDDQNVLMKIRPSLAVAEENNRNDKPQDLQRREFNTVIRATSGVTNVLGGLYVEYEWEEIVNNTNMPLIKKFLNRKAKIKKRSHFIFFIKVTIC